MEPQRTSKSHWEASGRTPQPASDVQHLGDADTMGQTLPGKTRCPMSPDPFATDDQGRTRLHHAAALGDLEAVNELLRRTTGTGMSPQRLALIVRKDASGATAIDLAEAAGHEEIARRLAGEKGRMEFFE